MKLELEGKVAVVTGGSKGIGRGIADALADEGCNISICSRNEAEVRQASSRGDRGARRRPRTGRRGQPDA